MRQIHHVTATLFFLLSGSAFGSPAEFKTLLSDEVASTYLLRIESETGIAPETRRIYFFDTEDLHLFNAGVVVRLRQRGSKSDLTIKLRPAPQNTIGLECEWDITPVDKNYSCSLKEKVAEDQVLEVLSGQRSIRDLMTAEQLRLLRSHAPESDIQVIRSYGPVEAKRIEWVDGGKEMTYEEWTLTGGVRLCEISLKVADLLPKDEAEFQNQLSTWIFDHGWSLSLEQSNKTPLVFEMYNQ